MTTTANASAITYPRRCANSTITTRKQIIPPEIVAEVLLNLPIDSNLKQLHFVSIFAPILTDRWFITRHIARYEATAAKNSLVAPKDLPFIYKLELYRTAFETNNFKWKCGECSSSPVTFGIVRKDRIGQCSLSNTHQCGLDSTIPSTLASIRSFVPKSNVFLLWLVAQQSRYYTLSHWLSVGDLSLLDSSAATNYAVLYAVTNGHVDAAKLLLSHPNVTLTHNYQVKIFRVACDRKYFDVLRVLLFPEEIAGKTCVGAHLDPSFNDHEALRLALANNCFELSSLLLHGSHVDVKPANTASPIMNY
ncbi:UNVERIFIED_CONTAM: hypothetical protein HDU68_000396 [Siphonaria sp. JEL0065]|nr:hypothetical protein HDU68_000396 [Siphonaria sp. JEL0065]